MSATKPYSEGYGTLTYDPTNGSGDADSKWMSTINTSRTDRTKSIVYKPQGGTYSGVTPKTLSIALKKSNVILKLDKVEINGISYSNDYKVDGHELGIPGAHNTVPTKAYYLVKLRRQASNLNGYIYIFLNGNVIDVLIDQHYSNNQAIQTFNKSIFITSNYVLRRIPSESNWISGVTVEKYPPQSEQYLTTTYHPEKASLTQEYSFPYDIIDETREIAISEPYAGGLPFPLLNDLGDIGAKKQMIYMAIPFSALDIENDATRKSMLTIKTAVIKDRPVQDGSQYINDLDMDFPARTLNIVFVVDDDVANLNITPNTLTFDPNAASDSNYAPVVQVDSNIPWEIQ